jgi:hypothetical protein
MIGSDERSSLLSRHLYYKTFKLIRYRNNLVLVTVHHFYPWLILAGKDRNKLECLEYLSLSVNPGQIFAGKALPTRVEPPLYG